MPNVLLAEDDAALLRLLADCLADDGYTVHATSSGTAAWQMVTTQPIDLVVADHRLPGMSGGHLCHTIASTPPLAHIPMIVVSGRRLAELSTLCPAAMLLTKPFRLDDLRDLVATLCPLPA